MEADTNKRLRGWKLDKAKQDSILNPGISFGSRPSQSTLATKLLHLWANGTISATCIQSLAHAAMLDGASHPEIASIASAGTFGQHAGNIARDLACTFLKDISIPPSTNVSIPLLDPKTSKETEEYGGIFCPHLMFAAALEQYSAVSQIIFPTAGLESFWRGVEQSGDAKLEDHPMTNIENWHSTFVPLFIHGDGVEFTDNDTLLTYSWGCLLTEGCSEDTSMLLSCLPKACTLDAERGHVSKTWVVPLEWARWSFNALFHNEHPLFDPWGKPHEPGSYLANLAGKPINAFGFRAVVWALEGDQEYFCNVLRLPHWSSASCCWDCNTTTADPELDFHNLLPKKQKWIVKTTAVAKATLTSPHPFFDIIGVTSKMVAQDALHILFCKGVLSYFMGSVLHRWCFPNRGRRIKQPEDILGTIFDQVQREYVNLQTRSRITNLKLSMFTSPDKPWANQPFLKLKAAETKHLLKPLARIAALRPPNDEVDARIAEAFRNIDTVVDILDVADTFLTPQQHQDLKTATVLFLGNYQWLHDWSAREDGSYFNITIKFHMFHHLVLNAKHLNPRAYWCFKGEDYVGRVSHLAASVSFGVRVTRLWLKIADKYRHWFHLRLTRGDM